MDSPLAFPPRSLTLTQHLKVGPRADEVINMDREDLVERVKEITNGQACSPGKQET